MDEVVSEARTAGRSADGLLLERKLINAEQLSRAIAERYGLPHVDLNTYHVDMGAANLLSVGAARRYQALPVGYVDPETLIVVTADPRERPRDRRHQDDHRPQLPVRGCGRR